MQTRRCAEPDIAFLGELARQRALQGLAVFHAAARQVPAGDIGVLDQEDAILAVDDHGADAKRGGTRQAPVEMHERPGERP
jgi:hypothetical protein